MFKKLLILTILLLAGVSLSAQYRPDQIRAMGTTNHILTSDGRVGQWSADQGAFELVGSELRHTNAVGTTTDVVDLATTVPIYETVTTLVDNGDGSFTYISEDGTSTTFTETLTSVTNVLVKGNKIRIGTYNDEDAVATDFYETVTSLTDNGDGTFTYIAEDETSVTFDAFDASLWQPSASGIEPKYDEDVYIDNTTPKITLQRTDVNRASILNDTLLTFSDEFGNSYTYQAGGVEGINSGFSGSFNNQTVVYDFSTLEGYEWNKQIVSPSSEFYSVKLTPDSLALGQNDTLSGFSLVIKELFGIMPLDKRVWSFNSDGSFTINAEDVNNYTLPAIDGNANEALITDGAGVVSFQNINTASGDNDLDPGNEYNTNFVLNGNDLEITDGGGTLTVNLSSYLDDTVLTEEQVQDYSWNVLTGLQSLITVTYDDINNEVDFVVEPNLSNYTNDIGFLTAEVDGDTTNELADFQAGAGLPGALWSGGLKQGDLYFDSTSGDVYVYDNSVWKFLHEADASQLTQEEVEDYAFDIARHGTGLQSLITVTYDDANNNVDYVVEPNLSNYTNDIGFITSQSDDQQVDNFSITSNILTLEIENDGQAAHTVDLSPYLDDTVLTQEQVEDYIDGLLVAGSNITLTYNDVANTLTITSTDTNTQLTEEQVQDFAWNVLTGLQTLITVTYDDINNNVDFIVNNDLSLYDNSTSGFITAAQESDDQNLDVGTFNTSTGDLTIGIENGTDQTVNLDGRYLQTEVDGSTTNELQDFDIAQMSGNNLQLSLTQDPTTWNIDLSQFLDDTDTQLTQEEVEDYAFDALRHGTGLQSLITVTYDDVSNNVDYVVEPNLSNYTNDVGFLTDDVTTTFSNLQAGKLIGRYTNEDGTTYDIDESITTFTSLPGSGNNIGQYNNEQGTPYIIRETVTQITSLNSPVTSGTNLIGTYNNETSATFNILETITELALNGNSLDFTDETETVTSIDLSGYLDDTVLSQEQVEDYVNGLLVAGTNITLTYNDAGNSLTIDATDTNTQLTQEQVQDFVGPMVSGNTETLITVTYDDANNEFDFVVENDLSLYDNSISGFITSPNDADSDPNNEIQTLSYNVTTDVFTLSLGGGSVDITEDFQDNVGAMVTGNTETGIAVTYQDVDGTLDFVVTDASATNELQDFDIAQLNGTDLELSLTQDPTLWTIDLSSLVNNTTLTQEEVEDFAFDPLRHGSGTQSLITVTYDDANNQVDYTVNPNLSNYTNDAGFITAEVDGNVSNEGSLSVGAGTNTTALLLSNTAGSPTITFQESGDLEITENTTTNTITFDVDVTTGETNTTFADLLLSGNLIGTYTNEDAVDYELYETNTSFSGLLGSGHIIGTYNRESGSTQTLRETVTSLSYSGLLHRLTYTDENGTATQMNLDFTGHTNVIPPGNQIAIADYPDGTTEILYETITSLVDNGDGTISYFAEDGDEDVVDICSIVDICNLAGITGGELEITGKTTLNYLAFSNSNVLEYNQLYFGNLTGSYFTSGEYQKILTIIPNGNAQNYQVVGTITAQSGSDIQKIDFNAALRSNALPDLDWEIIYDEEITGAVLVKPQLWTKETTTAGFIFGFEVIQGTIYGNVTVDMRVVPRTSGLEGNLTMNTSKSSEQGSVDTGYTANDMILGYHKTLNKGAFGKQTPVAKFDIYTEQYSGLDVKFDGQSNTEFGIRVESNAGGGSFESDYSNGSALLDLYANAVSTTGGDLLVARTQDAEPLFIVKGNDIVGIGANGNLGTGKLQIKGDEGITLSEDGTYKVNVRNGAGGAQMHFMTQDATGDMTLRYGISGNSDTPTHTFYSGALGGTSTVATISGLGLGVFEAVPDAPLHVTSLTAPQVKIEANASNYLTFNNAGHFNMINSNSNNENYRWAIGGSEYMRLTNIGLGVGTTPAYKLDINGTANVTGFRMNTGAASNRVLISNVNGDASWSDLSSLTGGTDDQTLQEVLTSGNDAGGLDALNFAEVEADEFIGDLRGAVLFKAQAGEALSKGDVVYVSGISGNTTIVSKADADDATKMPAFGVVAAAASLNNPVDIYTFGTLSNLNTSTYTLGDVLYVSTTAGQLTATPPTGESALIQNIAKVTRVDNSAGSIKISGAGRTNATPNLNTGRLFVGNASNQAVADGTMYVDIANARVGIGTSSPSSKFHVNGGGGLISNNSLQVFKVERTGSNPGSITQTLGSNDAILTMKGNANENWVFTADQNLILSESYLYGNLALFSRDGYMSLYDSGGAIDIKLNPNGNSYIMNDLGIGTTNPTELLHVNGTARFGNQVAIGSATTTAADLYIYSTSNTNVRIADGSDYIDMFYNSDATSNSVFLMDLDPTNASGTAVTEMRIDIDNAREVTITPTGMGLNGVTSPSSTLDIIGDIQVSDLPTDDGATKMVAWGVDSRLKSTTLYTHSRVGIQGVGADLNSMTDYSSVSSADPDSNTPFGASWYNLINIRHRGGILDGYKYGGQIAFGMTNYKDRIAFRSEDNATWTSWKELYHTDNISDLFNNMGEAHSTRSSFDSTTPSYDFGWRYVAGSTNGPGTGGSQFYSAYIGLGSQYSSTGAGSYGMYMAIDRNVTNPYLSIRYNENNSLSTWRKISAGQSDKLTTARNIQLTGDVTGTTSFDGSANVSISTTLSTEFTPKDEIRSLGTKAFTSGTSPNITTAQLVSEMEGDGAFDSYTSVFKTSWNYAGNYNLTDAGRFTETAGTSWITWTDNSDDVTRGNITALAIAPNTGGSAGRVFIYNDQGSSYSPGWREVWTSTSDGAGSGLDADKLDGQNGSYYQPASTALTTSTTFGGDVSGTYNNIVVADDSHNHIISNVDGLQSALNTKLDASSYTAADVLTKIKTVDGAGTGLDADLLDGQHGSYYLDYNNFSNTPTIPSSADFLSKTYSNNWTKLGYGTNGTAYWHKLAQVTINGSYQDYLLKVKWTSRYNHGELAIHIHSDNDLTADIWDATVRQFGETNRKSLNDFKYVQSGSNVHVWVRTPSWREFDYVRQDAVTQGAPTVNWYKEGDSGASKQTSDPGGTVFTEHTPWSPMNDGATSGLDADLWDGYQFADYLNQGVKTTNSPTFVGLNLSNTLDFGSSNANIKLSRGGWITFYEDSSTNHAIGSRDNTGAEADDIRINSYGAVYINLDSNNNNGGGADFQIGSHGSSASTISNLFTLSGETGEATFTNVVNATAVNTGQGDYELYAMNQNVRTSDSPTFAGMTLNGSINFQGANTRFSAAGDQMLWYNGTYTSWGWGAAHNYFGRSVKIGDVGGAATTPDKDLHIDRSLNGNVGISVTNTSTGTSARSVISIGNSGEALTISSNKSTFTGVSGWGGKAVLQADSGLNGILFYTANTSTGDINFQLGGNAGTTDIIFKADGNVGIGTSSPSTKLHVLESVSGDVAIFENSSTNQSSIRINGDDTATDYLRFMVDSDGNYSYFIRGSSTTSHYDNVNTYIWRSNASVERMRLNGTGLGIGTNLPNSKLDVNGVVRVVGGSYTSDGTAADARTDAAIILNRDAAGVGIYTESAGSLRNLIKQKSDHVIEIGQSGTAIVNDIKLLPGNSGSTKFYNGATQIGEIGPNGFEHDGWTTKRYAAETNANGWRKAFSYTTTANDNHIAYVRVRVMNSDFQGGQSQSPSVGEIEIAISRYLDVAKSRLQRRQIAGFSDIQDFIRVIKVSSTEHEVQIRPQRSTTKYERFTWEVSYIEFEPTKITWDFETNLNTAGSTDAGGSDVVTGDGTEFFDNNIEMREDVTIKGDVEISSSLPRFTLTDITGGQDDYVVRNTNGVFDVYNSTDSRVDMAIDGDGITTFTNTVHMGIQATANQSSNFTANFTTGNVITVTVTNSLTLTFDGVDGGGCYTLLVSGDGLGQDLVTLNAPDGATLRSNVTSDQFRVDSATKVFVVQLYKFKTEYVAIVTEAAN